MGYAVRRQQTKAWLQFQAAADALRGFMPPAPATRQLIYKPMHVSQAFKDSIRAESERDLRMAREAGMAVDMTNNWPKPNGNNT